MDEVCRFSDEPKGAARRRLRTAHSGIALRTSNPRGARRSHVPREIAALSGIVAASIRPKVAEP